jgi:hypothetical protein
VFFFDVNEAIRRNRAIDIAKEVNGLNAAIEKANGLNEVIEEITDLMDIDQSSISDLKHEFEPSRH